tara:strand:+ start:2631 stop:2834 length:204 start_codon:yes stop_codon:yes gene_type:complete
MSKVRVWRIYVPYLTDSIYEVKADTHEEAMQKHYDGESEYLFEGDSYDSDSDPEVELFDEIEEDNEE